MTKPEEFLFTGKCTGSSQESSPCWATPAAPSQNTRPPLGVNLFLFRARGVWLCKRKPAELRLALGPAFSQWPDKVLIVPCHMVAAFGWKERDSHTGLQAALWKREKSRQTHTEGGEDPCRRAVPALTHEVPHAQNPRLWAASPQAQALLDKAGTALAALRHPWPVLPAASELKRVPQPSSRITIRQHSAFCNLMLLYPNLFSWKRTKACWFYDVNPQILGV